VLIGGTNDGLSNTAVNIPGTFRPATNQAFEGLTADLHGGITVGAGAGRRAVQPKAD
jgi:hypothetical protein